MSAERTIVRGGLVFDGEGGDGRPLDVLVEAGRVTRLAPHGAIELPDARVIDATGAWVVPGFVDLHTHYDAEVEVLPGLSESVRHGVTTCVMGSCGLSMVEGDPVDLADMFCRVEGIPRSTVKPLLERIKTWDGPRGYFAHLETLPLGPNVAALLGHSAIRAAAMGLGRSLTKGERPTEGELARMEARLEEALDEGYLGLSINTLTWDKMDGDDPDLRSRPTPSTFATWSEYRRLIRVLRRRRSVLQGVPNVSTKVNVLLFYLVSLGVVRPGLKTMLITMLDSKASRLPSGSRAGCRARRACSGPTCGSSRCRTYSTSGSMAWRLRSSRRSPPAPRLSTCATPRNAPRSCGSRRSGSASSATGEAGSSGVRFIATSMTPRSSSAPTPRSSAGAWVRSRGRGMLGRSTCSSTSSPSTATRSAGTRSSATIGPSGFGGSCSTPRS